MTICLFEDQKVRNLNPLVYLRPVYDLRCGILSLRKKVEYYFEGAELLLHVRNPLENVTKEKNSGIVVNDFPSKEIIFINGRLLIDYKLSVKIKALKPGNAIVQNEDTVALCLKNVSEDVFDSEGNANIKNAGLNAEKIDSAVFINYPWDLISNNEFELLADYKRLVKSSKKFLKEQYYGVHFIEEDSIFLGEKVELKPGVILDATDGPIYISKGVKILHNAVVMGPAFIGKDSIIKMGATLYHNTNIGEVCKIGGEVEDSIIQGFSNKQHDGFLGHSVLGEWVNLGAGTNNSDLKNNYGNISVVINGESVNSGLQFVGLTMGDHSKSAIGTQFNTGTVVGLSSNIFGSGFPPKYVPSFAWGGADELMEYKIEKALEVAEKVMARRKIVLSEAEKELIRSVYEETSSERNF
ncbi:MAG: GlmU family protein [Melioribacteraceae bacterium]|nr:GlmU family protein [Melioribacteraceae bacterium]MCF8265071.1 GlmU family protein [Melioribacteraceae bacterium]MCF8431961.1 GlmU family protein [Melioribacteraceae bacterium]